MLRLNQFTQFISRLIHRGRNARFSDEKPTKCHLWSIGIYTGLSPLSLAPAAQIKNPVLTRDDVSDVRALLVADPFMVQVKGTWYMFFEVYNWKSHGEIGCAVSKDAMRWKYHRIVLAESVHLSYPYVFDSGGDYYMIPETHQANEVRLYKARRFPDEWECVAVLLTGHPFADSSIFHYGNHWWLFTETNQHKFDTLRLYYATSLTGPWQEHPRSPVTQGNPHMARPAGRVVACHDRLFRFAQNCHPTYGIDVRAYEVTELTPTTYKEQQASQHLILGPSGRGWNACGMHHIDSHLLKDGQWIACVDGWRAVDSLVTKPKRMAC
jgi:hypothetical protein